MAPVKIVFSDSNAQPPVYVAGAFTEWQAIEIVPTEVGDGQRKYEKTFDLNPGTYQYKFRLGPGDWWVTDGQAPRSSDDSGNENNIVVVEAEPEPIKPEVTPAPIISAAPTKKVAEQKEIAPLTEAAKPTYEEPAVKVNGSAEPKFFAHQEVTKAPESTQKAEVASEKKIEPVPAIKETPIVAQSTEAEKVVSQPLANNVDGSASPKLAAKPSNTKQSSESSIPPKDRASAKQGYQPEKQSWFSRIFLCGSSGKIVLAAVVVIVPVLAAYVIQK